VASSLVGAALLACSGTGPDGGPGGGQPTARQGPTGSSVTVRPSDALPAPAGLRLPAIGVTAAIVPVGVDDRGEMAVPPDVRTVGWYRFGPRPGSGSGSAVLAGHVDDRLQGRGAFFALADLDVGDVVQIDLPDSGRLEHRVRSVERIPKSALPVDRLFTRTGPAVLVLITCGGAFDPAARSYRQNVVVTAEPVR
jgi:sortase (surface protein transpeptidase)